MIIYCLWYIIIVRLLPRADKPNQNEDDIPDDPREERDLDVQQNITYFLACLEKTEILISLDASSGC